MVTDGYFDANNSQISKDIIAAKVISEIENSNISNALTAIQGYTGTSENFINFANAKLNELSGLTESETTMVNGYKSILQHSYDYWNNNTVASGNPQRAAAADAIGFTAAFIWALKRMMPPYFASLYANLRAVEWSITNY